MSLSSSTLSAIQKVGAAAFTADEKLKKEVQLYAERVNLAISKNAYSLGNDALIENWKIVARLSQTLVGIEEELKKVFQVASELAEGDLTRVLEVPVLAAPVKRPAKVAKKQIEIMPAPKKVSAPKKAGKPATPAKAAAKSVAKQSVSNPTDLTPTDVVVKPKKKVVPTKAKVSKPKVSTSKTAAVNKTAKLGSNPEKLLQHLDRVLNANEFTDISQTVVAQETGIPLGSMTAAIKKLVETGRLSVGPEGSLKLVAAPAAETVVSPSSEQA